MIFTITGRIPSKKNSKRWIVRGGRRFLVPSAEHEAWHEDAMWQLKPQKRPKEPFSKVLSIKVAIWSPDARKSDLSNKNESLMDLLVDAEIIADDNWFVVPSLTMFFMGVDKKNPRAEIQILY